LKSSRKRATTLLLLWAAGAGALIGAIATVARGEIPEWLQNIEAGTPLENALYRLMALPGGNVTALRPPQEARPLLDNLVHAQPSNADLYSLRAMEEEQQLDFDAAERDWKSYAQSAADRTGAQLGLADFYYRQARPADEIATLSVVAQSPSPASENLLAPPQQGSWLAFMRIFTIIEANAFPAETSESEYQSWIARYPQEASLYVKYFEFLLDRKEYDRAADLISEYSKAFPDDAVFPVKARALLDYRKGDVAAGLAVYDRSFQPLWPDELIQGYFELLGRTRSLRKFLDASQAAHEANPDDINSVARLFYYYKQEGKPDAAQQVIAEFRAHKETAEVAWTGNELFTLARLLETIQAYPEAGRYYLALYSAPDALENRQRALAGLANVLLASPDQPLRLGAGDLSMYKDVATSDPGPGFLNGILSLLFNSEDPQSSFAEEEQRGIPYFHRAEAAKLLALLDQQFPNAPERAGLHERLIEAYVDYGESDAVIATGAKFLADFPDAPQRTDVSLLMADAYARLGQTDNEFAIYDAVLRELAQRAQNVPLGSDALGSNQQSRDENMSRDASYDQGSTADQGAEGSPEAPAPAQAFSIVSQETTQSGAPRASEYASVLERYLARLAALKQLPRALEVLRREVDRNPNDPGLYERLAQFLEQNQMDQQEEEVYQRAIQQFPDRSWYHKLARLYLRHQRADAFEQLTNQVVKIFEGSDLESYFRDVVGSYGFVGPQLYLRLNLYANQRFPHNLTFVHNLLNAYHTRGTYDEAAWENVLRQHWFEDDDLRAEYFEYLSRSQQLDATLEALRTSNAGIPSAQWQQAAQTNPAAVRMFAEAELWQSHFEDAMPALGALAGEFPADRDLDDETSAVYRSLAYFDGQDTEAAVRVEQNLLKSDPANRDTLARIGDIYADRDMFAEAAPYWNRMAEIDPGKPESYLSAATVFWDYYKFDDALRLLNQGRAKLGNENLFSYEEGAIFENERDYPRAIAEYVKGALADGENSQSWNRLAGLARRPKLKDAADRETSQIVDAHNPAIGAICLRVKILEVQGRKTDIRSLLLDTISRTDSLDLAEQIEALAREQSLEDVRERAIEQQAKLTTDPVHRLELRYALVHFFESKKDFPAAQAEIEALYRENPKILGVVRATVDFYWQRKMQQRAIDVLQQAATDSYPALRDKFNYEAARKATDFGNYALARQLLDPLLQQSPYDAELLAAMSDTYAREGDSAGLRDFYLAKIALFRQAPLATDERAARIAELRRGLIPALTQLKDYSGAIDQYIEITNQFPEDSGLTAEAALYAQKYGVQSRLLAFYAKTVSDSPRDFRWSMVLARMQMELEDYPAAIASYTKSIAVRPDRVDLYEARADLLERLMRFDEAAADYSKLYDLSYHDQKWMMKVAEIRARQGKPDDCVQALKTAIIAGRSPYPQDYFEIAQSLESWGLLVQAKEFAQQGADAAGADLLANSANRSGAQLYVRILTRLREYQTAYARLENALDAAQSTTASLSDTLKQVDKQGFAAVTDSQWRQREQQLRYDSAREGMDVCMKEMGGAVAQYFTPEETSAFSQFLASKQKSAPPDYLIYAAEAAQLSDLEARWRYEALLASPSAPSDHLRRLIQLQSARLKYSELAGQLEKYADVATSYQRRNALWSAAAAYRAAGDSENELRIYSEGIVRPDDQHYFELLFALRRQQIVDLAGSPEGILYESAANFAVGSGDEKLAMAAIRAHGAPLPPVWTKAYTGLAGLYYADGAASVNASFVDILDDRPIGERLGEKLDLDQQLAGDVWFYYASRYGEYLAATHQGNPEDYLPAELERSPGSADAYLTIAGYYSQAGDVPRAIASYQYSLELNPDQPAVHDRVAVLDWDLGQHAQAIAAWKRAIEILEKQQSEGSAPQSFWSDFASITQHLGQRKLAAEFRPNIDSLLREYIGRNRLYNLMPLLRAEYSSLGDPATGAAWLLDLSSSAGLQEMVLVDDLARVDWIPLPRREMFFQRDLELTQAEVARSEGEQKESAEEDLRQRQVRWIEYLLDMKQYQRAKDAPDALPEDTRNASAGELTPLELRIAAELNTLDPILSSYQADPDHAPSFDLLSAAATSLEKAHEQIAARKILEFAYSREIRRHNLSATNFLGLAEIRLDSGDTKGALDLLNRLVLVVGEPCENLDAAAALLESSHHPAEAAVFLAQLVRATPWEPGYRLRLARAQFAANNGGADARKNLAAIAAAQENPYALRADAATALGDKFLSNNLGSGELTLLAAGAPISVKQANAAYFTRARILAASDLRDDGDRVALLRATLEDRPSADAARIQLLHAATAMREYQLAYSAAEPLRNSLQLTPNYSSADQGPAEQPDAAPESSLGDESQISNGISRAERLRIAIDLATATENLDRLEEAVGYLQIAQRLESAPAHRAEIRQHLARLRVEIDRRATNAARQPEIHRELEQNHLVRPRLIATSPASAPALENSRSREEGGQP
jgi:tetratricopeptide (TPR) repeat protein